MSAKKGPGPFSQGGQPPQAGYPGYRRPFYRRRGSIISFILFIVICLVCLAVVAAVWIVPNLLNGSFSF